MMPWFLAGEKIHFSNQIFSNEINREKTLNFFPSVEETRKLEMHRAASKWVVFYWPIRTVFARWMILISTIVASCLEFGMQAGRQADSKQ